jgi:hypothetical protein
MRGSLLAVAALPALIGGSFLASGGCAHEDAMMAPAVPVSRTPRPAWVDKGSGAYPGEKGKIFAVGISPAHMDDESLARETADNDGRTQMQRVFEIYIAALMEQYKRFTSQSGQGQTEIDVKSVSRSLTEGALRGSQISDHWQNPQNATWYSLVVVDIAAFKEFAQRARDLDASMKDYIRDNADRAQDDLSKHLAERNGNP